MNHIYQNYNYLSIREIHNLPECEGAFVIVYKSSKYDETIQLYSGLASSLKTDVMFNPELSKWLDEFKDSIGVYYKETNKR